MKFIHEYDETGSHRLVATEGHQVGAWVGYAVPAKLVTQGGLYFVVTQFWSEDFKPDTVYEYIQKVTATVTRTMKVTASA